MRLSSSLSPLLLVVAGCTQSPTQPMPLSPASCSSSPSPQTASDQDRDGLDDAMELVWAQRYLPYLSISPDDHCPTAGIIARVTPTSVAGLVRIRYDVLYNDDCGIGPHIGDDERFAMTVDVSTP